MRTKSTIISGIIFIILSFVSIIFFQKNDLAIRAGMSGLLIGIFLIFVNFRDPLPQKVNEATMLSSSLTISKVLKGLRVKGNGIFMPAIGDAEIDKVFVPLHENTTSVNPNLIDEETVFFTEGFSKDFGALIDAPGSGIVDLYEDESETKFSMIDAEMIGGIVKIAEGLDIVSSIDSDIENDAIKITFTHTAYHDMCKKIRKGHKEICTRSCCPICASILESFSRSLGKPIQISEVKRKGSKITIRARILEWSS